MTKEVILLEVMPFEPNPTYLSSFSKRRISAISSDQEISHPGPASVKSFLVINPSEVTRTPVKPERRAEDELHWRCAKWPVNLFVTEVIFTPNGGRIPGGFIVCRKNGTVIIARYPQPLPLLNEIYGYYIFRRRGRLAGRNVSTGSFIHPEVDFGGCEVADQTLTLLENTLGATLARHSQCHSSWVDQFQKDWSANEDSQSDISAPLSPRADFECATRRAC